MGQVRKYRTGAYIPRVLQVLADSPRPMTRKQIAAVIGTTPESIATAMLDLTKSGGVVKLPHTPAVAATYRLPVEAAVAASKSNAARPRRVWAAPRMFPWTETAPVSLPLEPWADTVPAEAMEGGKDARKPAGRSCAAKTASGAVAPVLEGGGV
jgi:hypothetical protein